MEDRGRPRSADPKIDCDERQVERRHGRPAEAVATRKNCGSGTEVTKLGASHLNFKCSPDIFRASHDSEYRKLKTETKRLLEVVGNVKKSAASHSQKQLSDIAKLSEEMAALKDGKNSLEKKLRSCTCQPALKAIKTSGAGDSKVDQITSTAKAEIQKLVSVIGVLLF